MDDCVNFPLTAAVVFTIIIVFVVVIPEFVFFFIETEDCFNILPSEN